MSAPKNEQDVAVDWDYEKMTSGGNVKFPPLDSDDFPPGDWHEGFLNRLRNAWNKHSQHWDTQCKIDILDYLWDPPVTENIPSDAIEHLLYLERTKFSAYVVLKCLYPHDYDLPPHRFIRWGKYPAIGGDEHQVTDWDENLVDSDWGDSESPAQGHQWSGDDVEAVNEGVRNSVQDEPDESLKTKNKVIVHDPWWNASDAPLSPALDQQNKTTADGLSEDFVRPGSWVECPGWTYGDDLADGPLENRSWAKPDSESGRSKETALQENSAEDDSVYTERNNPYPPKGSGKSAYPRNNAFASKFSSETETSEVGVFTPASSNVEQAPALSDQQIQELKGFITKTTNDAVTRLSLEMSHMKVAHLSLSLEMSHMKNSLDEKIDRMREDSNPKLNRAKSAERSRRGEMESLQLYLSENASTRQQLRELRAKVAKLGKSIATL